ncbi:MAG TPA: TonB family protein [Allosphingosinicella sp.]
MNQASIYQPKTASPTSFGMVVLLHGAAIAALVFAKMEMPTPPDFVTTQVDLIKVKPPPPEVLPPEPKAKLPPPQVRHYDPVVEPLPQPRDDQVRSTQTDSSFVDSGPRYEAEPIREPEPLPAQPAPVRKAARLISGDLEPPYPISEQRAGAEGSVTVRLAIGTDGKVARAEKVRASSDAFFQATQRHALRNWRFKPATLDGRPVESSTVMTVHFKLDGEA